MLLGRKAVLRTGKETASAGGYEQSIRCATELTPSKIFFQIEYFDFLFENVSQVKKNPKKSVGKIRLSNPTRPVRLRQD